MREYTVILEKGETSWGAYVPDLPGCVAVAEHKHEAERLIQEAIEFHIEAMVEAGESIPEPNSESCKVRISA